MGIDFNLLSKAIKEKEGDHIYISVDKYGWEIQLWNRQAEELIGTYCIPKSIKIETILSFIPENNLSFCTNDLEVEKALKEMGLCQ